MSVDFAASGNNGNVLWVGVSGGPAQTALSVSAWIRWTSLAIYNAPIVINMTNGAFFGVVSDPGALLWANYADGGDHPTAGLSISINTWYHVVGTYNGSTVTLYLDGVSQTASYTASSTTVNGLTLGGFNGTDNTFVMQDAQFYARVLSAGEVFRLRRLRQSVGSALAVYPMLGGGQRLLDVSGNALNLSVISGSVSDSTINAPVAWSGPVPVYPLRVAGGATSITASGVTNVTGAAAITSAAALVASGTTNVTGAAAITTSASAAASGTTQVTGAATITKSAAIVATGTTQVTGAADVPSGLLYGFISNSIIGFSAWVYPRSNVAASDVFWVPLFASSGVHVGAVRIAVNGTTLRFETTNTADASSALYQQSISLNAWTHVSYQIDRSGSPIRARAYVNGVELDASAIDLTSVASAGRPIIGKNADMTIRDADISTLSASQVAGAYALRNALLTGKSPSYAYFPLLSGSAHLSAYDSIDTLSVLGNVVEGSENPPAPWGGPNTLQYLTAAAVNIAITATGTTQVSGAASMSSAAPIVAAGTTNVTGAAALTAAAPITATGVTQVTGAAAVTASAPLVAAGVTQVTGAVGVDPTWPIVATGTTQVSGAAAISASAPIVAAGLTQVTGAANLTTPGDVAGTGLTQVTGTAALTAAAPLVAAGTTQTTGLAALASSAPVAAAGATNVTGVATVSSSASAASSGTTQVIGSADVSIAYSITAAGVTQVTGSAAFQGVAPPSSPGGDTFLSRRFLHTVGRRHVR